MLFNRILSNKKTIQSVLVTSVMKKQMNLQSLFLNRNRCFSHSSLLLFHVKRQLKMPKKLFKKDPALFIIQRFFHRSQGLRNNNKGTLSSKPIDSTFMTLNQRTVTGKTLPPEKLSIPQNRCYSQFHDQRRYQNQTFMYYTGAVIVTFLGLSYAAVPLYELICTQTGLDGTPVTAPGHKFSPEDMKPVEGARPVRITFDSSVSDKMKWKFTPVTREIKVVPGETALAFYTAKNETDEDIVGISTYSVVPAKAAQYFNKIQCFCFEEQLLASGEEVDMPVFFYLDPEFAYDPWMKDVSHITLSYTFFKSKFQNASPLKSI